MSRESEILHVERKRALLATLAVGAVLVLEAWHATAHVRTGATLASWQSVLVATLGMIAPFLGVVLMWGRRWRAGALLMGAAMAAGLLYDLTQHYGASAPESVAAVARDVWGARLARTAFWLLAARSAALAVAAWILRADARATKPARAWRRAR